MKGLPLTKSVLVALTLLLPATHGRAYFKRQQRQQQDLDYPAQYGMDSYIRQEGRPFGRFPNPRKTHISRLPFLRQRLESLPVRMNPLAARVEEALLSNDLDQNLEPLSARMNPLATRVEETLFSNDLDQNIEPLPARMMPLDVEETIISNDLDQNLAISPEDLAPYTNRQHHLETHQSHGWERSHHHGHKTYNEEVCSTQKGWYVVKDSVDLDGNPVGIIQVEGGRNQTYYSYKCENQCTSCKNVMGNSVCKQRYTYVYLYHYLKHNHSVKRWGFVEVPSHCACELVPPNSQDPECIKMYE